VCPNLLQVRLLPPRIGYTAAVPDAAGNSFTIHLNKAVSSDRKVGWFIVNWAGAKIVMW
jgi:hypothetical protein